MRKARLLTAVMALALIPAGSISYAQVFNSYGQDQQTSGIFAQKVAQFRQTLSMQGMQGDALLFADDLEVAVLTYAQGPYSTMYSIDFFSGDGQNAYPLGWRGQDANGNMMLVSEAGNVITVAPDGSWMEIANLKRMNAATAEQCDKVLAHSQEKAKELGEKYWLFSELFAEIKKGFNAGIEGEENLKLFCDGKELIALARIPSVGKWVVADYAGWSTSYFNATPSASGSNAFTISDGKGQVAGTIELSADGKQLFCNGRTFALTTVEQGSSTVDSVRLEEDRKRSYQDFINMYNTWSKAYGDKLEYVNNANVKEVYKFSARSQMADFQAKMREVRQRAARVGYNIQPGVFETSSNTAVQSELNNYQSARDGVRYGRPHDNVSVAR